MKYEILTIIGIVIVAVLIASLMSALIQEYQHQACNQEKDNNYFYTEQGCYDALNRPLVNQIMIFVGILFLELLATVMGSFFLFMGIVIYRELKEE